MLQTRSNLLVLCHAIPEDICEKARQCRCSYHSINRLFFCFSQTPQISSGLVWLNSSQTVTGNWPRVSTSEYYSTTAALDVAYILEPASSTYSIALAWLSGQLVSPTDYLARRIIALKRPVRCNNRNRESANIPRFQRRVGHQPRI
jgi:hypothetical protein